ncbi:serine/threonine-protein kinase [Mycobacterium sp. 1164966.3]|uniref:serine/threonine-protein kinase n=1 Tax=Mycobacterium sp. 1164966.3 TaxID=1856861 RepID=UPI0009EEC005|nr:serine/threonine-protein kinase [Mycobacterium sp. 1164966.3]
MDEVEFGRYRLQSLLGEGGMGEVWRAHDTETDRIVAIKVLPANLSEDEDFKRRFRREAHAAARLNDPHVIPIHNYGEIDGRLYLDMRLIKGRDLAAVLADGPLEPPRAVHIVGQIAEALHAAHEEGLLHRDIKPSNILLGKNDFAYLIDFGIARTIGETRMTQTGSAIGTFQYIAPERLAIGADEDARADIYSLACVLYECLTGNPPFPGDTMPQLVAAHLHAPPPRPSITQHNVPAQFDAVIAKGMAKDPDIRYGTTVELADAARDAITTPIQRPTREPTQPSNQQSVGPVAKRARPNTPRDHPAAPRTADARQAGAKQRSPLVAPSSPPSTPRRARWWRRKVSRRGVIALAVPALLCLAAIVFAGVTGRLYLADRAAADAKEAAIRTAAEAVNAMWAYTPEDLDGLPDRAGKYLSDDFRAKYSQFVKQIATPNKQAKITTTTKVLGAGIESFDGSDATVIVYTNTTTTSPTTQPKIMYLSYRLIMQMHKSRWWITRMTTITSSETEPKLPAPA